MCLSRGALIYHSLSLTAAHKAKELINRSICGGRNGEYSHATLGDTFYADHLILDLNSSVLMFVVC